MGNVVAVGPADGAVTANPARSRIRRMSAMQRSNDSVLGPLERPALDWLVRRLPPKVVPDHLTAFGVFGALLTATGFVLSCRSLTWLWLASLGLIFNSLGASLG